MSQQYIKQNLLSSYYMTVLVTVENRKQALTGVAHLVGLCSAMQRVTGSIPGRGTCLGASLIPWAVGAHTTDQCFTFTLMFLSLSFSFPFPLSKNE